LFFFIKIFLLENVNYQIIHSNKLIEFYTILSKNITSIKWDIYERMTFEMNLLYVNKLRLLKNILCSMDFIFKKSYQLSVAPDNVVLCRHPILMDWSTESVSQCTIIFLVAFEMKFIFSSRRRKKKKEKTEKKSWSFFVDTNTWLNRIPLTSPSHWRNFFLPICPHIYSHYNIFLKISVSLIKNHRYN